MKLTSFPADLQAVDWELHEQEPTPDPDFSDAPVTKFVRPVVVGDGGVPSDHDVAVYKQFPFSAASRRCTVLARRRFGAGLDAYIKVSDYCHCGVVRGQGSGQGNVLTCE